MIQSFHCIVFYQILKFRCLILINFTWINTSWNQKTQLLFLISVILWFIVGLLWASVTAVLNPFVQLSLPSNKASSTYITSIPIALECPIIVLTQYSTRLSLAFSLPPDHSIILITYFHTFHLPSTPRLSLNLNLPCLVCSLIIVITIIILSLHWLTHLYISKLMCISF